MEICVRHVAFFEQHHEQIPVVLQQFIGFLHSGDTKVHLRSTHLFFRLVKHLKSQIGSAAESVIDAVRDLCVIDARIPEICAEEDMSSDGSSSDDTAFSSQLHLFEAIGCMSSVTPVPTQVRLAKSLITPICEDMEHYTSIVANGDDRAFSQIHHLIMALGTYARGFSDWVPGSSSNPVASEVSDEFMIGSSQVLLALESMNSSFLIRAAARFTFARMIGVLGFKILEQLMEWIEGFMGEESTKEDMANFLRLLDQIIYGFKTQFTDILDALLTPLLSRVFMALQRPTTGTDDELELGELRREYLTFLLNVLGNNLESVLVSNKNQDIFDSIVATIEHFAKDGGEHTDSKLALTVFTKMCSTWGGPDIPNIANNSATPNPRLPNFDQFMITRLTPITWGVMTRPAFDAKDAQSVRSLSEIAVLQQTILSKTGQKYLSWLRDSELPRLGMQEAGIDEYLNALMRTDSKSFKNFLVQFLQGRA